MGGHPTNGKVVWVCPKCGKSAKTTNKDYIQYCICTWSDTGKYTRMKLVRGIK